MIYRRLCYFEKDRLSGIIFNGLCFILVGRGIFQDIVYYWKVIEGVKGVGCGF